MKMYNAKIIDNKVICGHCGSNNISGIRDYKGVEMNGQAYVMFQVKCYGCNKDNLYLADVRLEGTTRHEVNGKTTDIGD